MNKMPKKLILIVFFIIWPLLLQAQLHVAITSFENQTDEILLDGWQRNLPDYLAAELGNAKEIVLLERNRLKELFAEMHLALGGFVEDSALVSKIGKMAGADVLISGIITRVEGRYVILAHLTRVKTSEVLVEKVEAPDNRHFRQMVRLLANNIRFKLTGEGEYKSRASLKKYPTTTLLLSTVVSGLIAGVLEKSSKKAYQDYHNTQSLELMQKHYDKANRLHKLSGLFGAITGVGVLATTYSWLKNMRQADLKAGSEQKLGLQYEWQFNGEGAGIAIRIYF